MIEEIIEQANLAWVAYAIAILVIIWQIYEFFNPSKPKPNAQPEIYQRLDEIKRLRRERNQQGVFNHKDLTKYDGLQNPQLLVAIKTDVFDVTNSKDFQEGGQFSSLVGQEVSVNFAKLSADPDYFFKYLDIELTDDEDKQLEATLAAFKANYKKVGDLYKNLPLNENDRKNI